MFIYTFRKTLRTGVSPHYQKQSLDGGNEGLKKCLYPIFVFIFSEHILFVIKKGKVKNLI